MWRLTVVLILYTAQAFHLPVRPATYTAPAGAYGLLQFRAADGAARAPAAALDVILDGRTDQTVVLTPGVNRTSYEALLGPLTAGTHEVRLTPSTLWQWDASITIDGLSVEVVPATDPRAIYLAHAPAIGLLHFSGGIKVSGHPAAAASFEELGYPASVGFWIGA